MGLVLFEAIFLVTKALICNLNKPMHPEPKWRFLRSYASINEEAAKNVGIKSTQLGYETVIRLYATARLKACYWDFE